MMTPHNQACKNSFVAIAFLVSVMLPSWVLGEPPETAAIAGKWWILGNTTRGTLEVAIDAENKVNGSIYYQPIRGSWNPDRGEISFVRFLDENATMPLQEWTGKLVEIECNSRKVHVLEGTFRTLNSESENEKEREYTWSGQSVSSPAPNLDLKKLQGAWKVSNITSCMRQEVKLPDELGLDRLGVLFEIQGNRVIVDGKVTGTLANDLQSPALASQVGFDGSRVMVLTTNSGQGFICSYFVEDKIVEIAYPHTTSCHRGSGHILKLVRIPDAK